MYLLFNVRCNLDKSEIKDLKANGLRHEKDIIDFVEANIDFKSLDQSFSHGKCMGVVFEEGDINETNN